MKKINFQWIKETVRNNMVTTGVLVGVIGFCGISATAAVLNNNSEKQASEYETEYTTEEESTTIEETTAQEETTTQEVTTEVVTEQVTTSKVVQQTTTVNNVENATINSIVQENQETSTVDYENYDMSNVNICIVEYEIETLEHYTVTKNITHGIKNTTYTITNRNNNKKEICVELINIPSDFCSNPKYGNRIKITNENDSVASVVCSGWKSNTEMIYYVYPKNIGSTSITISDNKNQMSPLTFNITVVE